MTDPGLMHVQVRMSPQRASDPLDLFSATIEFVTVHPPAGMYWVREGIRMTISESQLDDYLVRLDRGSLHSDEAQRKLLFRSLIEGTARRKRSRRVLLGAASLFAIGGLVVPGAAFAVQKLTTQTGVVEQERPAGAPEEMADYEWTRLSVPGSEWLQGDAHDFEVRVRQLAPTELPLPDGTAWERIENEVAQNLSTLVSSAASSETDATGVYLQDHLIQAEFERVIWVRWIDEWIAADTQAAESQRARASDVLSSALTWPAFSTDTGGSSGQLAAAREIWVARVVSGDTVAAQALAEVEGASRWDGEARPDLIREVDLEAWGQVQ